MTYSEFEYVFFCVKIIIEKEKERINRIIIYLQ